jgi:predicted nucleotidyltransferase
MARELCTREAVIGLLLFGSVSRGDANGRSDIDLLVVIDSQDSLRDARRVFGEADCRLFSPVYHTVHTLTALCQDDWLFARHLIDEGRAVWDPDQIFSRHLSAPRPSDADIASRVGMYEAELDGYREVRRFHGDYFFAYAALFGLVKRAVIEANSLAGRYEFDRGGAFRAAREIRPELASDIEEVQELEPFYTSTRRAGRDLPLPFDPRSSEGVFQRRLATVRRLLRTLSRD